ncbi:substrate-binding periplasmic protein [Hoeflea alexandrii]|uniref:substrate-binding periplasmic protein n=1 Tax=Hoeflea alexandrii TaxID=288436 RepID=UPI0022AF9635|nr:transporter substrate-binding domain-containing protein [Hoeflea alexandrii]MCZ4287848.1 transporter substrate-binding domain-containing protein [Hoeflea alexandrii]
MLQRILSGLAVLLVAVFAASGPLAAKTWTKLRIGVDENFPPLFYRNANGNLDGFDYKIALALCAKMNVDCEFYAVSFDRINVALNGAWEIGSDITEKEVSEPTVDVLVNSMGITDQRKRFFAFTEPYYFVPHAILIRKDSGFTIKRSRDTASRTVGIIEGSAEEAYAKYYFSEANLKTFYDPESLESALESRQIEMGLVDAVVAYEWVKTEAGNCCQTNGYFNAEKAMTQGYGIAVRHEDTDLLNMLNSALTLIRANGTYESIRKQFFRFSIDAN